MTYEEWLRDRAYKGFDAPPTWEEMWEAARNDGLDYRKDYIEFVHKQNVTAFKTVTKLCDWIRDHHPEENINLLLWPLDKE